MDSGVSINLLNSLYKQFKETVFLLTSDVLELKKLKYGVYTVKEVLVLYIFDSLWKTNLKIYFE